MREVDDPGLDQLRLRQRRYHAEDRFIGEEYSALGYGVDVTSEAEIGEAIEKAGREPARAPEIVDVLRQEAEVKKSMIWSRPAAMRNPRWAGSLRTKNSKTAMSVRPFSSWACFMLS